MKNVLTNLFNSSFFRSAQRLAIVCLFLSFAATAAGNNGGKMTARVATNSTGRGSVYASNSATNSPSYATEPPTASVSGKSDGNYTWFLYAQPNTGYYHAGWTKTQAGTGVISGSNVNPFTPTETISSSNPEYKYYAVFNEQTVYKNFAQVVAILVKSDGTPELENSTYVKGGGFVDINATPTNKREYTIGSNAEPFDYIYKNENPAKWTYGYQAKAENENYSFVGWYSETSLRNQLTTSGKVDLASPDKADTYWEKEYNTTTLYSNRAGAPIAETMYAVFRPSPTYYHYGPAVDIAGAENERAAKGRVYADKGEAVSSGVPESQWQISIHDESIESQKDNKVFAYTYYAKVQDPTKIAFKGWSTTPNGEPTYFDNPLKNYEHTMTDENTSELKPYRTPTLYAVFESYYFKTPAVALANNSKGSGYVNVSLTAGLSLDLCTQEEVPASAEIHQVPATGISHRYAVHYYAKNVPGTVFEYWSSTPDGLSVVSYDAIYTAHYETSSKNENYAQVAPPLYAVFRSDIDVRQQDRMIVYVDDEGNGNINDSKVLIDFQKGNTLTATLTGSDAAHFNLTNRSGSKSGSSITFDATQGLIELVVAYKYNNGDDLGNAIGKKAEIILSAKSNGQDISRPVTIVVEEAPIITFLPTDGKGSYKVSMTNGSGVNYTMAAGTKDNIKVAVTHESMSNIEINLLEDIATDDYYFFGWQIIDGGNVTYLSYDQLFTYQFTKPVSVRADFVHKDIATYRILDDATNTQYHDFALAMREAEKLAATSGTQTVILNEVNNGQQVTKAILPKGNYTIPSNVRFLIPGKTLKTYKTTLDAEDFHSSSSDSESTKYLEYIRWVVEEGTTITVENGASVCILANIAVIGASSPNGIPYNYGHIELGENCKMDFLGGSSLYAFGYVTGPKSSSIVMNSGSIVKETLQMYDWRGGTAVLAGFSTCKNNQIFLVGQYFVQNIEAPLTMKSGAIEELDAALNVTSIVNMTLTFIGQNTGFFQLGNGYSMTKYYDVNSDRIQMTVEKEEGATGTAELGSISLNVTGIGEINSADYVLPLPHNYDVILGRNTTTNVLHDVALLPGATIHIQEGATCNLGVSNTANVIVYDKKYSMQGGKGYFGASDVEFFTIKSRPDGLRYKRTSATIQDASVIVDGMFNTPNGYIYTTNLKTETTDHGSITSNGGGKVQFNALGTKTETYQARQGKVPILGTGTIDAISVPMAPARLLNANGTYKEPADNTTYTYINGRWIENTAETQKPNIPTPTSRVPVFNVTDYTTSAYVGKPSQGTTTITTNNANVDWTKVTWTYKLYGEHANQFGFTWGTKPNGTITFTPTSDGVKTATLRITATYKYTDTYGVAGTYIYSKDIHLTGNASYLNANTLAFADLNTVYKGQTGVYIFKAGGNNTKPITITANPANSVTINGNTAEATLIANTIGEVTITATQPDDLTNNIAGTTLTKTIEVKDPVQWNWDILYLGEQYDTPITMLNDSTGWTLEETTDTYNIIDFRGTAPNYTASVANLIAGSFNVTFTFTQGGQSRTFISHVIVDPRHLRVDVNNDTVFRAVTLSANDDVRFVAGQNGADGKVVFESTNSSISQWRLGFFGVPDKIYFQAAGTNTWQIEESSNGTNWTTSFPWKNIAAKTVFEHSLLPSTRYLRISYGAGKTAPASLSELYITELTDVKANVEKLYIPVQFDAGGNVIPYTKEVVFTYANTSTMYVSTSNDDAFKVKESTSTGVAGDVVKIQATTEQNPFGIMGIEVVSTAKEEMEGYLEVHEGTTLKLQIPIQTYLFPQELPIKLATDKPDGGDRYYYVTTHTHNAEWDGRDGVRTITLNNAVSDAAPYLIFEFKGNPTYISFNYTDTAKGTWELEEYIDDSWHAVPHNSDPDVLGNGVFKRFVSADASKLRLIYQSEYAEKVEVTDLVIVGDASAIVDPARLELDYDVPEGLTVSAINLPNLTITSTNPHFTVAYNNGTLSSFGTKHTLNDTHFAILNGSGMGDIPLQVKWLGSEAIEHGTLELTDTIDGEGKLLAIVELIGVKQGITDGNLGIYTGVATGYTLAGKYKTDGVTLTGKWQGDARREVNIDAAFDPNGAALFDYVVVYGETTTSDGSKTINQPNTLLGSNAKTPCYIYKKNGNQYQFHKSVENANSKEKSWNETSQEDMDAVQIPAGQDSVSMYITGFCPYASTGYTKGDEGVWYFRANAGQSINVYLQDCYIYSRAKTHDGHSFVDRQDGNSFSSAYSCGSGAVLVFACNDKNNDKTTTKEANPMNVTICTLDSNLLKSNYGCFLQSAAGRAFQVSPAVQIRLIDDTYYKTTTTVLNFTDEWPISKNAKTWKDVEGTKKPIRTNGFLSLQKQHNNAPSIDMGAQNTIVNFNGGQVELQNAQIVSTNYISSMAICERVGTFAGIFLAYGMGTDGVGGTVNFNDGTTTVLTMDVAENYRQYYLMDTDASGKELTTTSCLRTPEKTFVKGGSHCMMRACTSPTSKGGAPKDKEGKLLGLYKYTKTQTTGSKYGWSDSYNDLVVPSMVPDYYGVQSVTPNNNGTKDSKEDDFLNFWFDPEFESSAQPEIDMPITFWKTCMTRIAAQYGGYGGSVGGNTSIEMAGDVQNEEVINLMYCKIDEHILAEIGKDSYQAPVKNPAHVGEAYLPVHPSEVGDSIEHYITNEKPFQVEGKIYYITTATADVWKAFTAPFDVANIYIMETYPEKLLQDMEGETIIVNGEEVQVGRSQILLEQAKHNADFAAFFAVTVALGQQKDFETIYREYIDWAKLQDKASGAWDGKGTYTLRGKSALVPYNGTNWATSDFYLNENDSVWQYTGEVGKEFKTKWVFADASDGKLMHKGMTYSMLLPFCTKCSDNIDDGIDDREFWDYWSGKFLIFESTAGPHIVDGTAAINEVVAAEPTEFAPNDAKLTGNHTFNAVNTVETYIWNYVGDLQHSTFSYNRRGANVNPTESFLMANIPSRNGMPARGVTTSGQVIYDTNGSENNTPTNVQRPGVSEGHSLFITKTTNGINIAVAQPQQVRVLSSTGAILFSGMVHTAVDVALPIAGVYVITGENEVQKILF